MNYTLEGGWLGQARRVPSPNCEPRPAGCEPDLLVIHNISLPPGQFEGDCIERFFTNCLDWDEHPFFEEIRGVRVSAHLLVRRDGELLQFVDFDARAWHAGQSAFRGRQNCNDFSIGIPATAEKVISVGAYVTKNRWFDLDDTFLELVPFAQEGYSWVSSSITASSVKVLPSPFAAERQKKPTT